jgi:hypothetical protein
LAVAKPCGEISQTAGVVEVLRAKSNEDLNRVALKVQAPFEILCTDVVVTQAGSRAKIKLSNGVITMSPNSRIFISKVAKGSSTPSLMNLTYGKIRTFFDGKKAAQTPEAKKDTQSQFRIQTSTAVVGVRGTDFFVGFDPNKELTTQATLKGEVEVEQTKTAQKVFVKSGEEVQVEAAEKIKSLEVKPIEKETVVQIRQTSPLVKLDKEFTSQEAVSILGAPEKWTPPADEIPGDLKDIKNVF